MNNPPSRFELIAAELAALGITIAPRPGEYRVNFRGGRDDTARDTDDLDEALAIGRELAAAKPAANLALQSPATARRQWRPKKMTPKAIRRRMIRAHNRRLRTRATRQQAADPARDA